MPRYEFHDKKPKKFWEISLKGKDVTTHWGRIATAGQTKTKTLDTRKKSRQE